MSASKSFKRSTHRHLKPHFDLKSKNPIAKMLLAHIDLHDFQRNQFLNKMRYNGGVVNLGFNQMTLEARKNRMRSEREETVREVLKALVYSASYKANTNSLFEVKMSVKSLAKMINQLHVSAPTDQYRHGRENYKPVLSALKDLAAAGLVMLQQNYSVALKRYQSMRIFITPELFTSLGITKKKVRKLIHSQNKYDLKNGFNASKENKAEHLRSLMTPSIQNQDSHSLKALKQRIKNEFGLPDDLKQFKKTISGLIKSSNSTKHSTDQNNEPAKTFNRLVVEQNIPAYQVFSAQEKVSTSHPTLNKGSPGYYEALIKILNTL